MIAQGRAQIVLLGANLGTALTALIVTAGIEALAERFSALVKARVIAAPEIPGTREFLAAWHRILPLFIVSATPEEELLEIVSERGLVDFFEAVHGTPVTKADHLRRLIARHGLSAERTVMVGDAPTDHAAALAAGTRFVGVAGGAAPFGDDVPVIPDLNALPTALGLTGQPAA
jgi:phosphoglycolate phosphatase-like HAD superfamily hydrolase